MNKIIATIFTILFTSISFSFACSCVVTNLNENIKSHSIIVHAKILTPSDEISYLDSSKSDKSIFIKHGPVTKLKVLEILKGNIELIGDTITISNGICHAYLYRDSSYIIFLFKKESNKTKYETNECCGNIIINNNNSEIINQIKEIIKNQPNKRV
jgi:hypothetical protein